MWPVATMEKVRFEPDHQNTRWHSKNFQAGCGRKSSSATSNLEKGRDGFLGVAGAYHNASVVLRGPRMSICRKPPLSQSIINSLRSQPKKENIFSPSTHYWMWANMGKG